MKILLPLLLSMPAACAPPEMIEIQWPALPVLEVHADDLHDVAHVIAATAYLEHVAGCRLWAAVEPVPNAPFPDKGEAGLVQFFFRPRVWVAERTGAEDNIGYWWRDNRIVAAEGLPANQSLPLIMHELGHSLGLVHVDKNPRTLMHPFPTTDENTWEIADTNWNILVRRCPSQSPE